MFQDELLINDYRWRHEQNIYNFNNENLRRWLSERLCGIVIVGNIIIFADSLVVVVEDVIHNIITTIIFWITYYH